MMGMIDISAKAPTLREAVVEAHVIMPPEVISLIKKNKVPKGNVLEQARLAGVLAAKQAPYLLPLCHPISLEHVQIDFLLSKDQIRITTTVKAQAKTGVEMEALVATAICALTIYDMCKPLDKEIVISGLKLLKKTGGKSGTYIRKSK